MRKRSLWQRALAASLSAVMVLSGPAIPAAAEDGGFAAESILEEDELLFEEVQDASDLAEADDADAHDHDHEQEVIAEDQDEIGADLIDAGDDFAGLDGLADGLTAPELLEAVEEETEAGLLEEAGVNVFAQDESADLATVEVTEDEETIAVDTAAEIDSASADVTAAVETEEIPVDAPSEEAAEIADDVASEEAAEPADSSTLPAIEEIAADLTLIEAEEAADQSDDADVIFAEETADTVAAEPEEAELLAEEEEEVEPLLSEDIEEDAFESVYEFAYDAYEPETNWNDETVGEGTTETPYVIRNFYYFSKTYSVASVSDPIYFDVTPAEDGRYELKAWDDDEGRRVSFDIEVRNAANEIIYTGRNPGYYSVNAAERTHFALAGGETYRMILTPVNWPEDLKSLYIELERYRLGLRITTDNNYQGISGNTKKLSAVFNEKAIPGDTDDYDITYQWTYWVDGEGYVSLKENGTSSISITVQPGETQYKVTATAVNKNNNENVFSDYVTCDVNGFCAYAEMTADPSGREFYQGSDAILHVNLTDEAGNPYDTTGMKFEWKYRTNLDEYQGTLGDYEYRNMTAYVSSDDPTTAVVPLTVEEASEYYFECTVSKDEESITLYNSFEVEENPGAGTKEKPYIIKGSWSQKEYDITDPSEPLYFNVTPSENHLYQIRAWDDDGEYVSFVAEVRNSSGQLVERSNLASGSGNDDGGIYYALAGEETYQMILTPVNWPENLKLLTVKLDRCMFDLDTNDDNLQGITGSKIELYGSNVEAYFPGNLNDYEITYEWSYWDENKDEYVSMKEYDTSSINITVQPGRTEYCLRATAVHKQDSKNVLTSYDYSYYVSGFFANAELSAEPAGKKFVQGSDATLHVNLTDEDGEPVDVSGVKFNWYYRTNRDEYDEYRSMEEYIKTDDPATAVVPLDVEGAWNYYFYCTISDGETSITISKNIYAEEFRGEGTSDSPYILSGSEYIYGRFDVSDTSKPLYFSISTDVSRRFELKVLDDNHWEEVSYAIELRDPSDTSDTTEYSKTKSANYSNNAADRTSFALSADKTYQMILTPIDWPDTLTDLYVRLVPYKFSLDIDNGHIEAVPGTEEELSAPLVETTIPGSIDDYTFTYDWTYYDEKQEEYISVGDSASSVMKIAVKPGRTYYQVQITAENKTNSSDILTADFGFEVIGASFDVSMTVEPAGQTDGRFMQGAKVNLHADVTPKAGQTVNLSDLKYEWYYYSDGDDWVESHSMQKYVNSDDPSTAVMLLNVAGATEYDFYCTITNGNESIEVYRYISIEQCEHTYTTDIKAATCTAAGSKVTRCTICGAEFETETIPAAGHKYDSGKVTKAATCTATGVKTSTCTVCKATKTETIAKTAHSYTTVTKAATCTAAGSRVTKCSVCGAVSKTETIAASGHKYDSGKVTKAATCTATGVKTYTCTVCKATKTETVAKTAHSYTTVTTAATCTAAGSKVTKCSVCGTVSGTETIPQLAHTYGEWKETKAATALAAGTQTRTCSVCGTKETKAIAKLKKQLTLNVKKNATLPMKTKQKAAVIQVTKLQKGDSVKWSSSNKKVVTVSGNNTKATLKAVKKGTATIKAKTASGLTWSFKVKVSSSKVKTKSISVASKKVKLKKGKKYDLKTTLNPLTSTDKVTYKTSSKKIATVSSKGVITAKKAGKATITVKSGKKSVKITVTVTK